MTLVLINISLVLLAVSIYLYRKLKNIEASLASFKPTELVIGARIDLTKDEETQLSKNKDALRLMNKLCDQIVSLKLTNIDDKSMKDTDIRYLQGEIHSILEVRSRINELYKRKIDE